MVRNELIVFITPKVLYDTNQVLEADRGNLMERIGPHSIKMIKDKPRRLTVTSKLWLLPPVRVSVRIPSWVCWEPEAWEKFTVRATPG